MNSGRSSAEFIQRGYARERKLMLVCSAAAVLIAAALTGAGRLGWFARGEVWALIPAILAAILLGIWIKRIRRLTPASFAQTLDTRWQLRSRLEATVELAGNNSALAQAQRNEAAQQLVGRENHGSAIWFSSLVAVVVALGLLGVEGSAGAIRALHAKAHATAADTAALALPEEERASIDWKTPAREIKATAIEEVPLTAMADSLRGFRAVTLEVFVNGEPKVSHVLDPDALGDSGQPGPHDLTPSLFVDETGAKPFDIVSYHLTGRLKGKTPAGVVTSPLQFVEIRPPQKDAAQRGRANPDAMRLMNLLMTLKAAQLRLMDANFTLAHLIDAKGNSAWQTENARVATEQKDLVKILDETRDFAVTIKAPALVPGNLDQAHPLMLEAAKVIEAHDNNAATKPQGHALALITECEKIFNEVLETTGSTAPVPPMADPFHDEQVFKLPPREATPAGQLEKLAVRQNEAAKALKAADTEPSQNAGVAQGDIARDATTLASNTELGDAVRVLTRDAAVASGTAARQIKAHDVAAAREPAGAALVALDQAVEEQDRIGREIALAELIRIRRNLNAASRTNDTGARGAKLFTARDELRVAAVQQQRTGSAEAARQLAALADLLGATKIPGSASSSNSTARAQEIATTAARGQIALAPRAAAFNRAVHQLNRGQQGSSGSEPGADVLAEVELGAQEAAWLTGDESTIELAKKVSDQSSALQETPPMADKALLRETVAMAARLATTLETARATGKRNELVRHFNVDDIDPVYRGAVENYFERLSRDGTKKPAAANP